MTKALAFLKPEIQIPITVSNRARLAKTDVDFAVALVERWARKLSKQSPLQRVEISIQEQKDPVGRPDEFEITLHMLFSSGGVLIASAKERDYQKAVREAVKRIERQRQGK